MPYENPKIKSVRIDYAKMEEENNGTMTDDRYNRYYSFEKVRELVAMSCEGIVPNGNYGDDECCMWSAINQVLRHNGMEV